MSIIDLTKRRKNDILTINMKWKYEDGLFRNIKPYFHDVSMCTFEYCWNTLGVRTQVSRRDESNRSYMLENNVKSVEIGVNLHKYTCVIRPHIDFLLPFQSKYLR